MPTSHFLADEWEFDLVLTSFSLSPPFFIEWNCLFFFLNLVEFFFYHFVYKLRKMREERRKNVVLLSNLFDFFFVSPSNVLTCVSLAFDSRPHTKRNFDIFPPVFLVIERHFMCVVLPEMYSRMSLGGSTIWNFVFISLCLPFPRKHGKGKQMRNKQTGTRWPNCRFRPFHEFLI